MGIVEEKLWFLQNVKAPEITSFAIGMEKKMYMRHLNREERTVKKTGSITKQRL